MTLSRSRVPILVCLMAIIFSVTVLGTIGSAKAAERTVLGELLSRDG